MRLLVVLLVSAGVYGADASAYLPGDAKFLMGVEVRRLMQSPLGEVIQREIAKAATGKLPPLSEFADIERVIIASQALPRAGKPAAKPEEEPFIATVQGRFDLARIRGLATSDGEILARYGAVEMIAPGDGKTKSVHFALISPSLILAGDAVSLREAIDRSTSGIAPAPGPLYRRAVGLAADNHVWITGEALPAQFGGEKSPAMAMLGDVRSIEMAMRFTEGMGLQLNLGANSAKAAQKLHYSLTSLLHLVALQAGSNPDAARALKQVSLRKDGSFVKLSLAISKDQLESGLASAWTGAATRRAAAGSPKPASPALEAKSRAPRPVERKVIRIIGAEGGDREIPIEAAQPE